MVGNQSAARLEADAVNEYFISVELYVSGKAATALRKVCSPGFCTSAPDKCRIPACATKEEREIGLNEAIV